MLARSFHVRKNNERVLNARSVRNEQNVPNVRSNYGVRQTGSHLNPIDYKIWSITQQLVQKTRINKVDGLKQRLIEVWSGLQHDIVDTVVSK